MERNREIEIGMKLRKGSSVRGKVMVGLGGDHIKVSIFLFNDKKILPVMGGYRRWHARQGDTWGFILILWYSRSNEQMT